MPEVLPQLNTAAISAVLTQTRARLSQGVCSADLVQRLESLAR